jgi:hypothetical protein
MVIFKGEETLLKNAEDTSLKEMLVHAVTSSKGQEGGESV